MYSNDFSIDEYNATKHLYPLIAFHTAVHAMKVAHQAKTQETPVALLQSGIHHLHVELLDMIFEYVPAVTWNTCKKVCKLWNHRITLAPQRAYLGAEIGAYELIRHCQQIPSDLPEVLANKYFCRQLSITQVLTLIGNCNSEVAHQMLSEPLSMEENLCLAANNVEIAEAVKAKIAWDKEYRGGERLVSLVGNYPSIVKGICHAKNSHLTLFLQNLSLDVCMDPEDAKLFLETILTEYKKDPHKVKEFISGNSLCLLAIKANDFILAERFFEIISQDLQLQSIALNTLLAFADQYLLICKKYDIKFEEVLESAYHQCDDDEVNKLAHNICQNALENDFIIHLLFEMLTFKNDADEYELLIRVQDPDDREIFYSSDLLVLAAIGAKYPIYRKKIMDNEELWQLMIGQSDSDFSDIPTLGEDPNAALEIWHKIKGERTLQNLMSNVTLDDDEGQKERDDREEQGFDMTDLAVLAAKSPEILQEIFEDKKLLQKLHADDFGVLAAENYSHAKKIMQYIKDQVRHTKLQLDGRYLVALCHSPFLTEMILNSSEFFNLLNNDDIVDIFTSHSHPAIAHAFFNKHKEDILYKLSAEQLTRLALNYPSLAYQTMMDNVLWEKLNPDNIAALFGQDPMITVCILENEILRKKLFEDFCLTCPARDLALTYPCVAQAFLKHKEITAFFSDETIRELSRISFIFNAILSAVVINDKSQIIQPLMRMA